MCRGAPSCLSRCGLSLRRARVDSAFESRESGRHHALQKLESCGYPFEPCRHLRESAGHPLIQLPVAELDVLPLFGRVLIDGVDAAVDSLETLVDGIRQCVELALNDLDPLGEGVQGVRHL